MRWSSGSSRDTKFEGALQGQRARKGIFITTGSFSREAIEFSSRIDSKIVLIDGKKLVDLMIDAILIGWLSGDDVATQYCKYYKVSVDRDKYCN